MLSLLPFFIIYNFSVNPDVPLFVFQTIFSHISRTK